jgi:hypothetical protein
MKSIMFSLLSFLNSLSFPSSENNFILLLVLKLCVYGPFHLALETFVLLSPNFHSFWWKTCCPLNDYCSIGNVSFLCDFIQLYFLIFMYLGMGFFEFFLSVSWIFSFMIWNKLGKSLTIIFFVCFQYHILCSLLLELQWQDC